MAFKKLFLFSATVALGALSTNALAAQNPPSVINSQTQNCQTAQKVEVSQKSQKSDKTDGVQRIIDAAEQQYRVGAGYLEEKQYSLAGESFDRAVDGMLDADNDARKDPRFRAYYLELVERVYKHQLLAAQQDGDPGFKQQCYESSPLDIWQRSILMPRVFPAPARSIPKGSISNLLPIRR